MGKKKEWEISVINQVKVLYESFPEGVIDSYESPDFLIRRGNDITGIEITKYIRGQSDNGSPKRHEEIVQSQVLQQARIKFESKFNLPLYILFQSSPHNKLSNLSQDKRVDISNLIVNKVVQNVPPSINKIRKVEINWHDDSELYRFVPSFSIMRVRRDSLWKFMQVDWIGATKSEFQSIIDKKNGKISYYLSNCNKIWLIIVATGSPISSNVDIELIIKEKFFSDFHKILFFDQEEQEVIQLQSGA